MLQLFSNMTFMCFFWGGGEGEMTLPPSVMLRPRKGYRTAAMFSLTEEKWGDKEMVCSFCEKEVYHAMSLEQAVLGREFTWPYNYTPFSSPHVYPCT